MILSDTRRFAERLHSVLREAYDEPSLARLLLYKLHERLDQVSSSGAAFDTVVFRLVLWADQTGRMLELARVVAADRPGRVDAQVLAGEMGSTVGAPAAALLPSDTADRGIPADVETLIRAFERIRRVMPEGDQRTVVMEDIVTQMRVLPLSGYDLPARLHLSMSEGERLAASVALRVAPHPAYLRWLTERLLVEYAFSGYQAAVALREAARHLSNEYLGAVADAIRLAGEWLASSRAHGRPQGRQKVLDEAMRLVITRTSGR